MHAHGELCFLIMQGSPIRRSWGHGTGIECGLVIVSLETGILRSPLLNIDHVFHQLWVHPVKNQNPEKLRILV